MAEQLRQLKPNKAGVPDDIPDKMLQEYADDLAPMLTNIMQQSYSTSKLPSDKTKARVTVICEKGGKTIRENCRLVSLTKVQEHIVFVAWPSI